jgi:hypothetical protein
MTQLYAGLAPDRISVDAASCSRAPPWKSSEREEPIAATARNTIVARHVPFAATPSRPKGTALTGKGGTAQPGQAEGAAVHECRHTLVCA